MQYNIHFLYIAMYSYHGSRALFLVIHCTYLPYIYRLKVMSDSSLGNFDNVSQYLGLRNRMKDRGMVIFQSATILNSSA